MLASVAGGAAAAVAGMRMGLLNSITFSTAQPN